MKISIETTVSAPLEEVWLSWTLPEHIVNWNFASNEWSCPTAYNNLRVDGTFDYRKESKDGKAGFNYTGTYTEVIRTKLISYQLEDDRRVSVMFEQPNDAVCVLQSFDAEGGTYPEVQKEGWQTILDRFKLCVESL